MPRSASFSQRQEVHDQVSADPRPATAVVKRRTSTPAAAVAPATVHRGLVVGSASDPLEIQADLLADAALSSLARRDRPTLFAESTRIRSAGERSGDAPAAPAADALTAPVTDSGTIGPPAVIRPPAGNRIRRSSAGTGSPVDDDVAAGIESARGRGRPLPADERRPLEQAFGAGFGGVRVHADDDADRLNRAVSARAFTVGSDIFLSAGARATHTPAGRRVLAHELAHTLQQSPAIRRLRTHDYDDRKVQDLYNNPTYTAQVGGAQAHVPALPIVVQLPPGQAKVNVANVVAVKAAVKAALLAAGVPQNQLGPVVGVKYELGVGEHALRIWSKPLQDAAAAPVQLLSIEVRVYSNGGVVNDAAVAGANWVAGVNNLSFDQAASRPFRENHTIEAVRPEDYQLNLLRIAIERQKASTLIQLTQQAKDGIVNEMKAMLLAGTCTTKVQYTTAQRYPILDIDPHADVFKAFDAKFSFALFHNPQNELWQMSHLEATSDIANNIDVANASAGGKAALHNEGQHIAFIAPATGGGRPNIPRSTHHAPSTYNIQVSSDVALKSMSIRVDCTQRNMMTTGVWKSARKQTLDGVLPEIWEYDWDVPKDAPAGEHSIWAEGRTAPSSKKTKAQSRGIALT